MHAAFLATILTILPTVELPDRLTKPACVACAAPAADGAPDLSRLRAGDIVLTEEKGVDAGGTPRHVAEVTVLLPYRPTQIWSVLVDFAGRPAWQPSAKEATVVRFDGDRVWVDE